QIISCSVIMPSWSDGEGGGPVHEALSKIIGTGRQPGDVLCVASAGNTARRHWSGAFHDGGDGYHEWRPGVIDNRIRPWNSERVPAGRLAPAGAGYHLQVLDATLGTEIGRSPASAEPAHRAAVVRFNPEAGHRYRLRVRRVEGTGQPFHVVVLG